MHHFKMLVFAAIVTSASTAAQAEPIIRDASLFETLPIEGVSLSTPPQDAFALLIASGYDAGDVDTYVKVH